MKVDDLRRMMKSVQELKEEYLIGSQEAFRYLQVILHYEKVSKELASNPLIKLKLSPTDVGMLRHVIDQCARLWLSLIAIEQCTIDNFNYFWSNLHTVLGLRSSQDCLKYAENLWDIDLFLTLQNMLRGLERLPENQDLFNIFVQATLQVPCFILVKTGQRFSGEDIKTNPEFRLQGDDNFWRGMEIYHSASPIGDTDDSVKKFSNALRDRNAVICHQMWKEKELREMNYFCKFCLRGDQEVLEYLVDPSRLMFRAESELALGRLEIERKVAIGLVYGFAEGGFSNVSISTLIDEVIKNRKSIVQESEKLLGEMVKMNMPRRHIESQKMVVRRARYYHLCVFQNRQWLKRYFSN